MIRALSGVLCCIALAGCGHRYVAFRATNPVIEDRVRAGSSGGEKMSVVSTRADRRTILVLDDDRICAEPPPDVAEAVSSQAVAKFAATKVSAGAGTALQTALMQLAQRSQGLEYFRTASFVYCNMFVINRSISAEQYRLFMERAAEQSVQLMEQQIEKGSLPSAPGNLIFSNPATVNVDMDPGKEPTVLPKALTEPVPNGPTADPSKVDAPDQ